MKKNNNHLIRICPVCGFSFKPYDPNTKKKINVCPMCGHKLIELNILPNEPERFDKKFF